MAFDQTTRNRLSSFVSEARALLTKEFARQLQSDYGIDPGSGRIDDISGITHLDDRQRETARILRDTLHHYTAGKGDAKRRDKKTRAAAIDRILREQAFTVLNRLAALRMMEARGLLLPSVAEGTRSDGFQLYQQLAGVALGETDAAYEAYLFSLFDEFAVDLPVLFDRFSPQGRLFPGGRPLRQLLELLNDAEIGPLWAEDETIGWIYQYFNSSDERRAMRKASSAPRNSRELAVRNQFFTPRYVVEFLTDNTLGRIWYEMMKGETRLVDECRYLVRRPHEVFLGPGEAAPEQAAADDLTQEELLNQTVYIPHRPLKDPREIKMLDPACGSMHFGLYAFDLFETIYEEAWEKGLLGAWANAYPDQAAFKRDVPRLIIEHNIHGIDIDARAVQIAGLSLWLRAQRSWQTQGVAAAERPAVTRSNVVVAEPMPGDEAELEAFLAAQFGDTAQDQIVAGLVRRVFAAMKLAGEAGSLLKIEEEIADDIAAAKEEWSAPSKARQGSLFERPQQSTLTMDTQPVSDEQFWEQVEGHIYTALEEFSERGTQDQSYLRRLFVDDAARGFAFINLSRQRYDVVLMNPPFGSNTGGCKSYMKSKYPDVADDIAYAFTDRCIQLASKGIIGAITTRTGFFLSSMSAWRNVTLKGLKSLRHVADLGYGVLDAVVETSAYTFSPRELEMPVVVFDLLQNRDKKDALLNAVSLNSPQVYCTNVTKLKSITGTPFAYWAPSSLVATYEKFDTLEPAFGSVKRGVATGDNFRFLRLFWEVDISEIGENKTWIWYAKGGEYSPYHIPTQLLLKWHDGGHELLNFYGLNGRLRSRPQNIEYFFRPGLAYASRTTSGFGPRMLNEGHGFDQTSNPIVLDNPNEAYFVLGLLMTRVTQAYVELAVGGGDTSVSGTAARDYTNGLIGTIPLADIPPSEKETIYENTTLGHMKVDTFGALDFASKRQENHWENHPPFTAPKAKGKG